MRRSSSPEVSQAEQRVAAQIALIEQLHRSHGAEADISTAVICLGELYRELDQARARQRMSAGEMRSWATRRAVIAAAWFVAFIFGAYSYAFRTFPVDELGQVARWAFPDRGRPSSLADVFLDTGGRQSVGCWEIDHRAAVILAMGQSNAANNAGSRYRPIERVYNFNWADGRCYRAEDPLLGTTGYDGSVWSRLGDALIRSGAFKEVLLVPVAVGGSSVRDWAGDAGPAARAAQAASTLRRHGLNITHVLWHQGEADHEMQKEVYQRLFARMTEYIRSQGIDAPVFVATATTCRNNGAEQIREAQRELPFRLANVFAGPDTDAIESLFHRVDNLCHLNDGGTALHVKLWLDTILRHEAANDLSGRATRRP